MVDTIGTFVALLLAYKSRLIRASENFKLWIVATMGGIAFVYLMSLIMGIFGARMPVIHDSLPFGIGLSVFVVIIAALNLVLDFEFIEHAAETSTPKYMEC